MSYLTSEKRLEIINNLKIVQSALTELVVMHSSYDPKDFISFEAYYQPYQETAYSIVVEEGIWIRISSTWVEEHRVHRHISFEDINNSKSFYFELSEIVKEFYSDYHDYCKSSEETS